MRLAILVPCTDFGPSIFWMKLMFLRDKIMQKGHSITMVMNATSYPIDIKRELMVEEAMKANPDYLMFLDSDMNFPTTLFDDLYVQSNPPVMVTALIHKKVKPYWPTVYLKVPTPESKKDKALYKPGRVEEDDTGLRAIDICGMAACIVPAEYFKKCPRPWFKIVRRSYKHASIIGEDFYFCKKIRKLGMTILVNLDCKVRHGYGEGNGFENYLYWRDEKKEEKIPMDEVIESKTKEVDKVEVEIEPGTLEGEKGGLCQSRSESEIES